MIHTWFDEINIIIFYIFVPSRLDYGNSGNSVLADDEYQTNSHMMGTYRNFILVVSAALLLGQMELFSQTRADSLSWAEAKWEWTDLGKGARAASVQLTLFESTQCVSIVEFPSRRFCPAIVHAPGPECSTTDTLAMRAKGRFAINGSYFNMKRLVPHTFFALNHKIVGEPRPNEHSRSNGILAIKGKKMEIFPHDTLRNDYYRRHYDAAIATGPILLLDGVPGSFREGWSFAEMRHPRSMVGWREDGTACIVVVDGRFKGQGEGMSLPEMVALCRLLGLKDAINLDGGGSATIWTDKTGILNHPYDNHKFDHEGARKVPNILVFR